MCQKRIFTLHRFRTAAQFFKAFIEYVYPSTCILCGARTAEDAKLICGACWKDLQRNTWNVLSHGKRMLRGKIYFSFVSWCFEYSDDTREIIRDFKFNNYKTLYTRIGREMADAVLNREELRSADALIPVPLHRARLRERGYNQSELLAECISGHTGIPVVIALDRIKNNRPQSTIDNRQEKIKNVRGIFTLHPGVSVAGERLILVDDIFTTGATVNECSKILSKARAKEIMILVACYAQ